MNLTFSLQLTPIQKFGRALLPLNFNEIENPLHSSSLRGRPPIFIKSPMHEDGARFCADLVLAAVHMWDFEMPES